MTRNTRHQEGAEAQDSEYIPRKVLRTHPGGKGMSLDWSRRLPVLIIALVVLALCIVGLIKLPPAVLGQLAVLVVGLAVLGVCAVYFVRVPPDRLRRLPVLIIGLTVLALCVVSLVKFGTFLFFIPVFQWGSRRLAEGARINTWLARAVVALVFVVWMYYGAEMFSLRAERRRRGMAGFCVVVSLFCLGMFLRTGEWSFAPDTGKPQQCYVVRYDGSIYVSDHPGHDPVTGLQLEPMTPAMRAKIDETRLAADQQELFFDPLSGQPLKWYSEVGGTVRIFTVGGFDRTYGIPLRPVTQEVVKRYLQQGGPPKLVGDKEASFFDPSTGEPTKYYCRSPEGIRVFDAPGYDPEYGTRLAPVTPEIVAQLRKQPASPAPKSWAATTAPASTAAKAPVKTQKAEPHAPARARTAATVEQPPAKPAPQYRVCPDCAIRNSPDARYCRECGAVL